MANIGRGATRLWIAIVALAELGILALSVPLVWSWEHENIFDQFDAGYVSVVMRVLPLAVLLVVIPIMGFIVWWVARWIARGFST
jgi:hypothetical protein